MIIYHDVVQGSDEWFALRRGRATASEFDRILTPKTGQLSKSADAYICSLIGDKFDPYYPRKADFATAAMRMGTALEPESRTYYELETNTEVTQVGFVLDDKGRFGCSPDGLILRPDGSILGGIEAKNPAPGTFAQYCLAHELPAEYAPQVHGQLIVTGAEWVDFFAYCLGFPRPGFRVRVTPNEYTAKLRTALQAFWERLTYLTAFFEENVNGQKS